MKAIAGIALAALAAAGVLAVQDRGGAGTDAAPAAAVAAAGGLAPVYVLGGPGGAGCTLELSHSGGGAGARLRPGEGCLDIHPDLVRALYWREDADGTIAFLSDAGEPVLMFGPDDGPGYLSFAPASAQLTLAEAPR